MTAVFSSASLLAEFKEAMQSLSGLVNDERGSEGTFRPASSPLVSHYQRELDLLALRTACLSVAYLDTRQDRISHEFPENIETAVEKARYINKDEALLAAPIPLPDMAQVGTPKSRKQKQVREVGLEMER